jgi:acyl carrier protein
MKDVLNRLQQLAGDWEYSGAITPESHLFADLGLESLDLVVLGTSIQADYERVLPFPELFANIGQRQNPDVSVSEWVDFVYEHLDHNSEKTAR